MATTSREAEKERLLQAMFVPLTLPASRDCRRLALIAYECLCALTPGGLAELLESRRLAHLAPLIDKFVWREQEAAWEALAAMSPEMLLALAGDALLQRDLERLEIEGEEARRARWYAGLEEAR